MCCTHDPDVDALRLGGASRREVVVTTQSATPDSPHSARGTGARLYETKGCVHCHTIDGSPRIGPSFKGSWGSEIVLADGLTLRFDEAYVRESLMHPHAKARAGFPPVMQSYEGLLKEHEVEMLIDFLRSLR